MLKKKLLVCLCCLTGVVFCASAQEAWTLEECIRYAYENHIQLKQQQLEVQRAENDLLQSKLGILPNLNASGGYSMSQGKTVDMNTLEIITGKTVYKASGNINSSVSLFKGLQQKNTIDRNLYSLLANIENVEKLKNELSIKIALYYLQIVHDQERLAVYENQLNQTMLQVNRTATLVEAGFVPEGNLFEIQSQAATDELQLVRARNNLDISRLNLAQLLDLETRTNFQILIPDFSNLEISNLLSSVDDVYATAVAILPQIKAAEYDLKRIEKQLAINRGYRSPTLLLQGSYGTGGYSSTARHPSKDIYPFWEQIKDGVYSSISLQISFPIFDGWRVNTGIKNAKLTVQNYQYQLQLTKNVLYKEIQLAYADAAAALKQYFSATKAVTSMEETFRYTQQKYEVGLMNFVDYSAAKTRLEAAQSDMLQAKFEYIFKTKVLDFYNGREIRL